MKTIISFSIFYHKYNYTMRIQFKFALKFAKEIKVT